MAMMNFLLHSASRRISRPMCCRFFASSAVDPSVELCTPVSRGFMAGMSIAPGADMEGTSFDDAFDLLGDIDEALLHEFERDLWELDKRRFIFGSKRVSVMDCVTEEGECMRLLFHNREPLLVQTAIPVDNIGVEIPPFPAMASLRGEYGMHLGGLVLALPLWRSYKLKVAKAAEAEQPKLLVLGGGGGVVPRTIAAAIPGAEIQVVESCADTRLAARTCFGLAELEDSTRKFQLHGGCGAEHLNDVPEGSVDVLIVDAASGSDGGLHAPPPPFRSHAFWAAVQRAMNPAGATFALNLVGRHEATSSLEQTILSAMPGWTMRAIPPPAGGLPDALALDQRLLFGSSGCLANEKELREIGLAGLEDRLMNEEDLWLSNWDAHPILDVTSK